MVNKNEARASMFLTLSRRVNAGRVEDAGLAARLHSFQVGLCAI